MVRLLPLVAILLVAFAAGVLWRRQRERAGEGEVVSWFGVLLWVPIGAAITAALVAAVLSLAEH